jgi:hypothetical protein
MLDENVIKQEKLVLSEKMYGKETTMKNLMRKSLVTVFVVGTALASVASAGTEFSKTVTFKTTKPAPDGFDAWTFFWKVPTIDAESRLDYTVLRPDGNEYYSRADIAKLKIPPGTQNESGFQPGLFGGDPAVFYNKDIRFVFRVTKGNIVFDPNTKYFFTFYKGGFKGTLIKTIKADIESSVGHKSLDANSIFSKTVTFKTAEPAPDGFDAWEFFWTAPTINPAAQFDYVVLQPDGNEHCRYDLSKYKGKMRSDFKQGFAGGNPAVFYNKDIRFSVRVTKGDMLFDANDKSSFTFYKGGFKGTVIESIDAVMESQ